MKNEYIEAIEKQLHECDNVAMLDLILKLLEKAGKKQ